jgi:hypothetical protein
MLELSQNLKVWLPKVQRRILARRNQGCQSFTVDPVTQFAKAFRVRCEILSQSVFGEKRTPSTISILKTKSPTPEATWMPVGEEVETD